MAELPAEYQLANTTEGRFLVAVQDRLKGLKLAGIPDDRIVVRSFAWVPDETELPPPYIIVSPAPETTNWQDGTNETNTTVFGAFVSVVLANGRDTEKGLPLQLFWRERIRRSLGLIGARTFTELNTDDGTFFTHGWVESGDKFIEAAKRTQRDASYYLVRASVKEPRE